MAICFGGHYEWQRRYRFKGLWTMKRTWHVSRVPCLSPIPNPILYLCAASTMLWLWIYVSARVNVAQDDSVSIAFCPKQRRLHESDFSVIRDKNFGLSFSALSKTSTLVLEKRLFANTVCVRQGYWWTIVNKIFLVITVKFVKLLWTANNHPIVHQETYLLNLNFNNFFRFCFYASIFFWIQQRYILNISNIPKKNTVCIIFRFIKERPKVMIHKKPSID